jgi:predicted MFS family arabinose efflux permease
MVVALGFVVTGLIPARSEYLTLLSASMLVASTASTFLAMSVESLMAYGTPDAQRGRAGGWFQAGNLGGLGLGGGAGLWLAQHFGEPWLPAVVLAVASLSCCTALAFVAEPPPTPRAETVARSVRGVLRDLWSVARSRGGFLSLLVCFLPIGTGAAANLFAAIADDWRASADTVALVSGVLGGIASAIGCFIGGYLCDRMDRKTAYWVFGLAQALCAVAMALTPRTEAMYIAFVTLYWVINGFTYAAFSAVVLEAIGQGAAATKYNLFASLSNMPIAYVTLVDGWTHTRWGSGAMLHVEAAIAVAAIALFIGVAACLRPTK